MCHQTLSRIRIRQEPDGCEHLQQALAFVMVGASRGGIVFYVEFLATSIGQLGLTCQLGNHKKIRVQHVQAGQHQCGGTGYLERLLVALKHG